VIAVFVADDPVVDCVLVVAPAPVTSAIAEFIMALRPHNMHPVTITAIIIFLIIYFFNF
jgi:hypothetical protein